MKLPRSWPERLYGLILVLYPRSFRGKYEHEMRLVFRDLLRDPGVSRWQLAGIMLRDLANGIASPERLPSRSLILRSALYGLIVVGFAIFGRAIHPGVYIGFSVIPIPFLAFIAAAYWGARQTGTFAGGMWVCLVMGLVASTMVLWDRLLFNVFPFPDLRSFLFAMGMETAFCIFPAIIGAAAGAVTAPREKSES